MRCPVSGSTAVRERPERAAQGYRRFRCQCGKSTHIPERSGQSPASVCGIGRTNTGKAASSRIAATPRPDVSRCLASRAPYQQDDIAEGTTNSETLSAAGHACANMFRQRRAAFAKCIARRSRSESGSQPKRTIRLPRFRCAGSTADRTLLIRERYIGPTRSECQADPLSRRDAFDSYTVLIAHACHRASTSKCCPGRERYIIAAEIGNVTQVPHRSTAGYPRHPDVHDGKSIYSEGILPALICQSPISPLEPDTDCDRASSKGDGPLGGA